MGKSLGFAIVAEGVEEEKHVAILAAMGCNYAQGFWFSRPQDETTVLKLIAQANGVIPAHKL
ncbi:EAL domain-containing protein [Rhodoferax sp.]|uniref:EAL domain-containing protein n=1 Tax=Rhodoferax sp. TaxID=50421 RepID=UPI00283C3290|nr:EAL domain-containing protein [Rhodoferax sp.]MDR3368033.1 EAL domain-containing protein [Rhodoferax sp.]